MRIFAVFIFLLLSGCTTLYPNQEIKGQNFPVVTGTSLDNEYVEIPTYFKDELSLLLIGYKQDSQFDIDRWLIGLDMTETDLPVYELPTIQGMAPRMFLSLIHI